MEKQRTCKLAWKKMKCKATTSNQHKQEERTTWKWQWKEIKNMPSDGRNEIKYNS